MKRVKADLFSVFMFMGMERLADGGKMAQINMQSWMFLFIQELAPYLPAQLCH